MKLSKDYYLRSILGENILVYTGADPQRTGELFTLNETGSFIVSALTETDDIHELTRRMTEEFATDMTTAAADLTEYLKILKDNGIITE